ncbi:MAG: RluA family pseudouridine synthase [Flavobacteriales bacterium]|jgi:23S rRNA pseudouridine1911/1915/1917 synthase|nr:RluA family pseudouridine synthase [Flavobacteriales bacterium]
MKEQSEENYEHENLIVEPGAESIRIDKYILNHISREKYSRTKLQQMCENGLITVNDQNVKSNYKVRPNDVISISKPYPVFSNELIAEDIPLDIIYEDDDLVVVNKPAGMVVHPSYGHYSGTLVNALLFHINQLATPREEGRPGLVHRIDKLTSGLLVVAKTDAALAYLSEQFAEKTSKRKYLALVWGDVIEDEGTIVGHIGRSRKNRQLRYVFEDGSEGKHAVTHYKVVERFGYTTLVECQLETGRTHQIRVHFQYLGHPLFGDPEYGGDKILKGTTFTKYRQFVNNCFALAPRQNLHAKTLGFEHPTTKEWMSFDSELADDMKEVIEKWRSYAYQKSLKN